MTDEDAFLASMLSAPDDDVLRLVFADWLDDRAGPGDASRAEFIRLSISEPETIFWPPRSKYEGSVSRPYVDRASALCRLHWNEWTATLRSRLGGSPLQRWLGKADCHWGYRRGFVAVFEGTQQVLLDAWDDLFRLGPIEEVRVNNLWHLGTITSLRQFLDRPSVRRLSLESAEMRDDCVDQLRAATEWLRRLDHVTLLARNPAESASRALVAWMNSDTSLSHIDWQGRTYR